MQAGRLNAIRSDSFDSGKNGAEEGNQEAEECGLIIAVGCKSNACNDRNQGIISRTAIGARKEDGIDCNDEDRSCSADGLMEWNGHKRTARS